MQAPQRLTDAILSLMGIERNEIATELTELMGLVEEENKAEWKLFYDLFCRTLRLDTHSSTAKKRKITEVDIYVNDKKIPLLELFEQGKYPYVLHETSTAERLLCSEIGKTIVNEIGDLYAYSCHDEALDAIRLKTEQMRQKATNIATRLASTLSITEIVILEEELPKMRYKLHGERLLLLMETIDDPDLDVLVSRQLLLTL